MILRAFFFMVALVGVLGTTAVHAQSGGAGAGTSMAGAASQQINQPGTRPLHTLGQNLSLSYYMSFLGPSPGRGWGETYNVFRDSENGAPYQMLNIFNLSYVLNPRWTVGATLAGVNDVSKKVRTGTYTFFGATPADNRLKYSYNENEREWFNARLYVNMPTVNFTWGFLTTQVAYELPTSNDAKDDHLQYGLVLTNALGIYMPSAKWAFGFTSQIIYYRYDVAVYDPYPNDPCSVSPCPTEYQTALVTVGPYLNYSLTDQWQIAGRVAIDWDKKGEQTLTEFNNNLPHWGRLALNHFWRDSLLTQMGLYTQVMLEDMGADRTVFGFDLTVRF